MKTSRPLDTSPEVERIQIEIYRKMGPAKRMQTALDLTRFSRKLLSAGVQHRHPEYSEEQVRLAVIRLTIPEKLFLAAYPHAQEIVP